MKNIPTKLALVSHVLPPSASGQAVVLYRLLRDIDPAQYCLLSVKDYGIESDAAACLDKVTQRLPSKYFYLPSDAPYRVSQSLPIQWVRRRADSVARGIKRIGGILRRAPEPRPSPLCWPETNQEPGFGNTASKPLSMRARIRGMLQWVDDQLITRRAVRRRAQQILQVLRQQDYHAVIACSGDLFDLPASFIAARRARLPFYAYMFDDYVTQWVTPYQRRHAERVARILVRAAAGVIVPNEFLARVYRQRYQVEPTIIMNPVEIAPNQLAPAPRLGRPLRIVYTGSVYDAHFDAFRSLLAALRHWTELPAELHIYTGANPKSLCEQGIAPPAVVHPQVSSVEALRLQESADILLLPLAFQSPFPEVINTSAPGKMGELLASGRPTLVHAPRDAFVCWYARNFECAAVVDSQDVATMCHTLSRLVREPGWRQALVDRAQQRARLDFAVPIARARFQSLISKRSDHRCAS